MKSCRLDAVTLHEDSGAAPGHVKVEGWLALSGPLTGQLSRVVLQRERRDGDRVCSGVWDARV